MTSKDDKTRQPTPSDAASRHLNAIAMVDLSLHQPAGLNAELERLSQAAGPTAEAMRKAYETLRRLQQLLGYVENGSEETVRIFQDDATRDYNLRVGTDSPVTGAKARAYCGSSLEHVIDVAYQAEGDAS